MTMDKDRIETNLELFRNLISKSNDAIFVNDPQSGLFIFVNDKACASLGYARRELLKMGVTDIETTFPDNFSWQAHVHELRQKGSLVLEGIHRRKDGTTFPVEANVSYVALNTREYMVAVVRDTTERKRSEKEIAERGAMVQQIMDTAHVGIGMVDKRGRISHANKYMAEMFRCTVEEFIGSEYVDHVHPSERETGRQNMFALLASTIPSVDLERRYVRKDGTEFWGHLACRRLHDAQGNELGLIGVITDTTERKKMEEALRESEKRYKAIVENQAEFVVRYLPGGIVTFINNTLCQYVGLRREDLLGRSYYPFMHPGDRESFIKKIEALDRDVPMMTAEARVILPDGRVVWHRWTHHAIFDDRGELVEYQSSGRDVTELREAEEKLKENEEKFAKIFHKAPLLITLSEIETGKLLDVNNEFIDISGFSREEVHGKTVVDLGWISHEQRERLFRELCERGRVQGMELFLRRKDGREVVCLYNGEVITVRGERVLLSIAQDITERKQAEEAFRESAEKYSFLVEATSTGYVIIDGDGQVVDANQNYVRMTGHNKVEDIIGRKVTEWTAKYDLDRNAREVRKCAERGFVRNLEIDYVDAMGRITPIEINANVLRDSGSLRIFTICRDITERRLLEEERLKTQKLESIGTLAGGIAHDFNNLLQGIFGYISMAKMTLDQGEKSFVMLEQAENALHQSVSLTTQLLTFSKGGKPVKKRISLLHAIENAAKFALSGSRSSFQLDVEPGLWQVDADEGQLGQVIQNIVLNADHAMPEGGTILITAKNILKQERGHPQLMKGNYVRISVKDSGIGIPEKYLQKIFDPYFTTKEKGSGLGLATSYSIIRNHDGLIDVISELGKGSTFHIYLPAMEVKKEFKESAAVASGVCKGKILVMDDDNLVRSLAEEQIKTLGHEVEGAEDGIDAIEKFILARDSGKPFDVVILDLTVKSGMGGEQTIKELREIDQNVKAIVSSGYANSQAVADYHSYGFRARLTKPYTLEGLRDTLNMLLRQ